MPPSEPADRADRGPVAALVRPLHRYFLLFLLAVYALSAAAPGPGTVIREFSVAMPWGGHERVSMLLLAILLFCAAAVIRWSQVLNLAARPSVLVGGLLAAWFGPAVLVVVSGQLLPLTVGPDATAGVLVGLALVAAMPVANSSAGWTQNADGNVALSLGLIVVSILLSPLATPFLLKAMGLVLSSGDTERIDQIVTQFSGWRFILWVILPSLAGAAAAYFAGPQRIERAKPWFRLITLLDILLLNYANASLAAEKILARHEWPVIILAAVLAIAVSLTGILLAHALSLLWRLPTQACTALVFGLSMKHTGLALVLAGEILHDQPRVILVVLLTTLAQHVAAAAVDWRLARRQTT